MMQVSKRVPFEDPTVLNYIRLMYIVSNIIILGLYFMTGTKIKAKNGMLLSRCCVAWLRFVDVAGRARAIGMPPDSFHHSAATNAEISIANGAPLNRPDDAEIR